MRFHHVLEDLLSSREKVRVLRVLVPNPPHTLTGRELAKLAGVSPQGARDILRQLEGYGLVRASRVGRVTAWSVNSEHYLFAALAGVVSMEKQARRELQRLLKQRTPKGRVTRAVLFGSMARGEEKPSSDIDVLVVVRSPQDKQPVEQRFHALSSAFRTRFGSGISPLVFTQEEFERETKRKVGVVKAAQREGVDLLTEGDW